MLPSSELFKKSYLSLSDVETALKKCDSIKYAAYRTAAKLRVIQKALFMDKIQLKLISCVFERHQLQQTENSVLLDQKELESVLSDIYFAVKRESNIKLDVDYVSQLMIHFLLSVYDKKMKNAIQVLSFKVGLTLFCQAKPREKYHYLFDQLADHNNCLSRKKLEVLLKKMTSITEYIGEGLSFGSELIPGTVESCFQCNIGSLGLSEDVFIAWLMQDPQLLVWLSTIYRMQISESVSHNARCGICKAYPLVGLRYRCLRCLSYDMCQLCFFTGKLNKKHKVKHPVQEYCRPMTSQQSTKAFLLTLRNRLYKRDSKLQYLPALKVDANEVETTRRNTRLLDELEVSSRTVVNGSRISRHKFPYKELQNIILQLERESEKIIPQIDNFCVDVDISDVNEYRRHLKTCLLKHNAQVKAQVQRLKLFRNYLMSSGKFDTKAFLASTPVVDEILTKEEKRTVNRDFVNLSPITGHGCRRREKQTSGRKMMWDNYDMAEWGSDCRSCDQVNPPWEEIKSDDQGCEILQASPGPSEENHPFEVRDKNIGGTYLDGKALQVLEESSRMGLTWFQDNGDEISERKITEENEETFQELQSDLMKILNKLHELSTVTLKDESEDVFARKEGEMEVAAEVDTLLVDLISGIEKLVGR